MKRILTIFIALMLIASYSFTQDIKNKIIVGYQGWFACSGDGSPIGKWHHWVPNSNSTAPNPNLLHFDLYPDMREYTKTYQTGFANLGNGQSAKLFSSLDAETVNKHVEWMQTYGIDAIAMQRFIFSMLDASSTIGAHRNAVTTKIKNAAETYGRKFYIMYDVSEWANYDAQTTKTWYQVIQDDWTNTIKSSSGLNLLASTAYAKEKVNGVGDSKPVVCIWGMGSTSRPGNETEWKTLITFFKNQGCYVIVGVNKDWRIDSNLQWVENAALTAHMISPWSVGAYDEASVNNYKTKLSGDFTLCNGKSPKVKALPVVWPGFSRANWTTDAENSKPRNHGSFMWKMFFNAKDLGIGNVYIAMFDEVDEGTAILKAAENSTMRPTNQWFLTLDIDKDASGNKVLCSSDFYLRLVTDARRMLRGEITKTDIHPTTHTVGSTVSVTGVTVSPTSATIAVNGTQQLTPTVAPSNATNKSVTWTSSNTTYATVSSTGLVTGKVAGSVTITVRTVDGGKTATSAITINPASNTIYTTTNKTYTGNMGGTVATWSSGSINIAGATSTVLSMDLEGNNATTLESSDYINVYYKINGGTQQTLSTNTDGFAKKTVSKTGFTGNTLEIIIKSLTSAADEFYYATNIKVTGIVAKSAPMIEKQSEAFTMYPNPLPLESILTINVKGEGEATVKIFDMSGSMVYTKRFDAPNALNLYANNILKSGLYIVSIISKDGMVNKKLIVK